MQCSLHRALALVGLHAPFAVFKLWLTIVVGSIANASVDLAANAANVTVVAETLIVFAVSAKPIAFTTNEIAEKIDLRIWFQILVSRNGMQVERL